MFWDTHDRNLPANVTSSWYGSSHSSIRKYPCAPRACDPKVPIFGVLPPHNVPLFHSTSCERPLHTQMLTLQGMEREGEELWQEGVGKTGRGQGVRDGLTDSGCLGNLANMHHTPILQMREMKQRMSRQPSPALKASKDGS